MSDDDRKPLILNEKDLPMLFVSAVTMGYPTASSHELIVAENRPLLGMVLAGLDRFGEPSGVQALASFLDFAELEANMTVMYESMPPEIRQRWRERRDEVIGPIREQAVIAKRYMGEDPDR